MEYFLGIDIGTTSTKGVAFNGRGELICKHSVIYEMQHPRPNYSELDPNEILNAVIHCINKIASDLLPAKPSFISFSAMMHSLIVVNEEGVPLTNCLLWADNRASDVARQLRNTEEGESFYHATGVPIHAMSPLCKLFWMKDFEPASYIKASRFIGIKEYIFFKLFNSYVIDTAIASATGLLNLYTLDWDKNILAALELSREKLSTIVPVEHILYYSPPADELYSLNIPEQTPFVIGGSDGALANLGAGSNDDGSMSVTIGTSAAVRILSDNPITEKNMGIFCYHANGDQYIIGGASNNGAVVMQWIKDSLLQTPETYEDLFSLATNISLANDDLFFVPYILGERAPVWDSDAKGIFCGLSINHTKAHLVRAAMEGITYNLYSIGKLIMRSVTVKDIYAAGGFAENSLWLQLLADVFNCRVLVSGSPESSALGAVIIGVKALKIPLEIQPSTISTHEPDPINHLIYQKQYHKFERLYKIYKNEFSNAGDLTKPIHAY
ncbi:MAG TPA: gluconokinase [Flavitalea sp.]|nr:gluconokinase [Flavitalea sp.]